MQRREINILLALDGSDASFEAARYVGRLLPPERTSVTLFHVLNLIPESFWDMGFNAVDLKTLTHFETWTYQQKYSIQDFMEKAKRLLTSMDYGEDSISMVMREREFDIARDIARQALEGYTALIVARKGMSELKDLIFGSVSNKLLSHLHTVPIWVVGAVSDPAKILVAMDRSEGAMKALEYVGDIFGDAHPELLLLHVTPALTAYPNIHESLLDDRIDWLNRARQLLSHNEEVMKQHFKKCIKKLKEKGAEPSRIETKIVPSLYSRAGAIFEQAQHGGYGTIVMGRRGLSRVEEFIMGRVSSKVLQLANEMAVWVIS